MVHPQKDGVGVIVGRIQEHSMSEAHKELIQYAVDRHNTVIVVLGESQCRVTKHDPLNFEMRRQMVRSEFHNVIVLPIMDTRDDKEWSKTLDNLVSRNAPPGASVVMYGSRDSFLEVYCGKYKIQKISILGTSSSTARRKEVGESVDNSTEFRKGVIWATQNQYPQIIPTVDIAIVHDNEVVMIRKDEDNGMVRFPGGHVDYIDGSDHFDILVRNARKETLEETAIQLRGDELVVNLGSYIIDDWRYKSSGNKIMTTLFVIEVVDEIYPRAGDDADDIVMISVDDIVRDRDIGIVPEHVVLFRKVREYLIDVVARKV